MVKTIVSVKTCVYVNNCLSTFNLKKQVCMINSKLNFLQLVEIFYPCRKEILLGVLGLKVCLLHSLKSKFNKVFHLKLLRNGQEKINSQLLRKLCLDVFPYTSSKGCRYFQLFS